MMENNGNGVTEAVQFDEEVCERYIFGELSETEAENFETAYFNDDAFFERFMAVKNELLDLYSRGELEAEKRDRLEPHFLATAPRTKRLDESREFIRDVTSISDRDRVRKLAVAQPTVSWFDSITRFLTLPRLAGAVALLVFFGGALLVVDRLWQRGGNVEQVAQQAPERTTEVVAPPNETPAPSDPKEVIGAAREPELAVNPSTSDVNTDRPMRDRRPEAAATDRRKRSGSEPTPRRGLPPEIVRDPGIPPDSGITVAGIARDGAEPAITVGGLARDGTEPGITLRPGSTRDIGSSNTLTLSRDKDGLPASIALIFKRDSYPKYIVTITTVDGKKVAKTFVDANDLDISLHDGSGRLVVSIGNTSRLTAKDYIVTLEGQTAGGKVETIEEYYFHVRRVPTTLQSPR